MSAKANQKFQVGDKVRMTADALAARLDGGSAQKRTGVVAGFPISGFGDVQRLVYVIRTGNRTKQSYHMRFWEKEESDGELSY